MISNFDRTHIQEFLNGEGSWFSAYLIRLIAKADSGNREKLRTVFAEHVEAYEDWKYGRGHYAPKEEP